MRHQATQPRQARSRVHSGQLQGMPLIHPWRPGVGKQASAARLKAQLILTHQLILSGSAGRFYQKHSIADLTSRQSTCCCLR
jgi:hypothetical protein